MKFAKNQINFLRHGGFNLLPKTYDCLSVYTSSYFASEF
jgi:hypothetical protein